MESRLPLFLEISAYLTGFCVVDLQGTGMGSVYLSTVEKETSKDIVDFFFDTAARILRDGADDEAAIDAAIAAELFPAGCYNGLARNIVFMWYTGQWQPSVNASPSLQTARNISPDAYVQGLVWTAADTHPPGAKQPGYGSWAMPPLSTR